MIDIEIQISIQRDHLVGQSTRYHAISHRSYKKSGGKSEPVRGKQLSLNWEIPKNKFKQ